MLPVTTARKGIAGLGGLGTGEMRFQLSAKCLMVWGSFTSLSLDFDRFLVWLAMVDGFLAARKGPIGVFVRMGL
jgi:hypothetical protein